MLILKPVVSMGWLKVEEVLPVPYRIRLPEPMRLPCTASVAEGVDVPMPT